MQELSLRLQGLEAEEEAPGRKMRRGGQQGGLVNPCHPLSTSWMWDLEQRGGRENARRAWLARSAELISWAGRESGAHLLSSQQAKLQASPVPLGGWGRRKAPN